MEDGMINSRVLPLLVIGVCLSQPTFAQINPFRGSSSTPLNADDLSALTDATNRLLGRPRLVLGDSEAWSNSNSGASGTVTAGNAMQGKGMPCRLVNYRTTVPGPRPQRTATLTWCKTTEGWKVAS
jgi:surface antigen